LKAPQDDVMLVDKFTPVMNGTVVDFDKEKRVLGMYLKNNQTEGFSFDDKFKTVNFYKIRKSFARSFFIEKLDHHIQQNDTGSYYELIIKEAIDSGKIFYAFETGERRWYEIDTREDLEAAEDMFKN
jgi:NDP-sugar pyrophosphorylase family protein